MIPEQENNLNFCRGINGRHHHACECRERTFQEMEKENVDLRQAIRKLAEAIHETYQGDRDHGEIKSFEVMHNPIVKRAMEEADPDE